MTGELGLDTTPQAVAALLSMGRTDDSHLGTTAEHTVGAVLRRILEAPVSMAPSLSESVPAVLGRECAQLEARTGQPLMQILLDEDVHLTALTTLKEYATVLGRRRLNAADEGACRTVYYAAIASALVFHGARITRHSYEGLEEGFAALAAKPWMVLELRDLFSRAQGICQVAVRDTEGTTGAELRSS